nr:hypothetical protein [Micromonospora sp. DSM 115978]
MTEQAGRPGDADYPPWDRQRRPRPPAPDPASALDPPRTGFDEALDEARTALARAVERHNNARTALARAIDHDSALAPVTAGHPTDHDTISFVAASGRLYAGPRAPGCPGDGHRHDIFCLALDDLGRRRERPDAVITLLGQIPHIEVCHNPNRPWWRPRWLWETVTGRRMDQGWAWTRAGAWRKARSISR